MAEQGIQQEIIQCSRCKKKHFVTHFRVNRLGRRNKTCLDCNAQKKAANKRIKSDPEKLAKMKRQARARWDRIKSDPAKKAAFYLKQCLSYYKRDYPDDPRPAPTTRYETYIRRELYRRAERRQKSEELGPEALARYDAYLARVTPEQAVNDWLELNEFTRFGDGNIPEKTEAERAAAAERLAAIKVIRENRRRFTRNEHKRMNMSFRGGSPQHIFEYGQRVYSEWQGKSEEEVLCSRVRTQKKPLALIVLQDKDHRQYVETLIQKNRLHSLIYTNTWGVLVAAIVKDPQTSLGSLLFPEERKMFATVEPDIERICNTTLGTFISEKHGAPDISKGDPPLVCGLVYGYDLKETFALYTPTV